MEFVMRYIRYSAIIQAVKDQCRQGIYSMNQAGGDAKAIIEAVNQGIDAHLEACFVPDRGDIYDVHGRRVLCRVSPESLPVLLRRLTESSDYDHAGSTASAILMSLGWRESDTMTGCYKIIAPYDETPGMVFVESQGDPDA
jgi:hypothetical protein